jgi:hypothetical protein
MDLALMNASYARAYSSRTNPFAILMKTCSERILFENRSLFYRNPLAQMEEEKKNHENKMKKMEQEMEQVFEMKVKERNQRLLDSEEDVSLFFCK